MKTKHTKELSGFTIVEILVAVFAVILLSIGGYMILNDNNEDNVMESEIVSESEVSNEVDIIVPPVDSSRETVQGTSVEDSDRTTEPTNQEPETTPIPEFVPIPEQDPESVSEPTTESESEIIISPSPLYQHILDNMYTGTGSDSETAEETESVPESEPEPEPPTPQTVTVEYTSSGFSPKTITIHQGDTVRFSNVGNQNVWISSNNHPTHTLYPEKSPSDCLGSSFDSCSIFPTGSSWEFQFNSVGSWGYHNHTRAGKTGTVIVE